MYWVLDRTSSHLGVEITKCQENIGESAQTYNLLDGRQLVPYQCSLALNQSRGPDVRDKQAAEASSKAEAWLPGKSGIVCALAFLKLSRCRKRRTDEQTGDPLHQACMRV